LRRHFYFPGFTPQSGGLLREAGLLARRDAFQKDPAARAAFWRALGIAPAQDAPAVSLFCYPNRHLPALLDTWSDGDQPVCCIVPEGVAAGEIDRWTGGAVPHAGQVLTRGRLSLAGIPFVAQDHYDQLLWACDVNFVRGEDSLVRAIWAARPLIWQPYPQPENAQLAKLDAFLARCTSGMTSASAATWSALHRDWNDPIDGKGSVAGAWAALAGEWSALARHAHRWAAELAAQPDLVARLVRMVESLI
jgi:uncharacterized repeat protein (TIGR03837 family)